jgi:hypothetical protein
MIAFLANTKRREEKIKVNTYGGVRQWPRWFVDVEM